MRVVLDTDVMVAGLRSDTGASRRLLIAALDGRLGLLVSVPLVLEYEAVLTRPVHLAAAGVSRADVGLVLDALVAVAEPVKLAFLWRPQLPDPGDDLVLEAAVNGQADALVTFNRRDFTPGLAGFGIDALAPGEVLGRLRG